MDTPSFPEDIYLYRQDEPNAGGARPLSQGDVFLNIPLLRAAKQDSRHQSKWVPQVKSGPKAIGILLTHPCSGRSRGTYELRESVSVAPVVRRPAGFEPPWHGYYEFFPLPALKGGEDYVADLAATCPVRSEYLHGHRIASLTSEGVAALFHRLALNSSRLDRIPDHFAAEANRLHFEMSLWELWATDRGTEHGFQNWLDEEFVGQHESDGETPIAGAPKSSGISRREVLVWNYEEIEEELQNFLRLASKPADV